MEHVLKYLISLTLVLIIGFATFAAVETVRSNGEVDYCYVEMLAPYQLIPQYKLWGHRPWRADRELGVFITSDEATHAADAMGCKLNGTK